MLRRVADSLADVLLESLPADRRYAPDAFERDPMPPPLAHFLRHTLVERAEREMDRLRTARSEWFDYDAPPIREALDDVRRTLTDHARVPASEWERALQHASYQVTRYLSRPLDTLSTFVFEDDDQQPMPLVRRRMQFFEPYAYLRDAVDVYAEDRDVTRLDRERFGALLGRVQHRMTRDFTPDQWLQLVEPLYSLMGSVPLVPEGSVPAALLHPFFAEHGHDEAAHQLHQNARRDDSAMLDRTMLRRLLEGKPDRDSSTADPSPAVSPRDRGPSVVRSGATSEPMPEPNEGAVPLWQQFQSRPRPAAPEPERAARRSSKGEGAVPLWQRFRPGAQETASDDLTSLERSVLGKRGAEQRERFVRHLFDGSTAEYRNTLGQIREARDWTEASRIIGREVFKKHGVNIYSETAVAFTDAVEARFR